MANEELSIRERLDILDGGVSGTKFVKSIKNGWSVSTSGTGLITATIEMDKGPVVFRPSEVLMETMQMTTTISELLPIGLFTDVVSVSLHVYSHENPDWVFLPIEKLQCSNTYTGEYYIFMMNPVEGGGVVPNNIFYTITAIGF